MRKSLSFSKGLTNVPSDLLSDDTELVESSNVIFRSGEIHPIQKPIASGAVVGEIIYAHKTANCTNVVACENNSTIRFYSYVDGECSLISEFTASAYVKSATSVGNTVLVSTSTGISYYLYKGGTYRHLGDGLPKPDVQFSTTDTREPISGLSLCRVTSFVDIKLEKGTVHGDSSRDVEFYSHTIKNGSYKDFQTAVIGHVSKILSLVKSQNCFAFPFFVRYALRLYDGSYARVSAPIAVFPTVLHNSYFTPTSIVGNKVVETSGLSLDDYGTFLYRPLYAELYYKADIPSLGDWTDIVKELVIFASDEVLPFYLDDEWRFAHPYTSNGTVHTDTVRSKDRIHGTDKGGSQKYDFVSGNYTARDIICPTEKKESEVIKELLTKTQFYKLVSINAENISSKVFRALDIGRGVVETLLQQEMLQNDDYYGWTTISPEGMLAYNSRVNLFGCERYPFGGFSHFVAYPSVFTTGYKFVYYVHIVSDTIDTWVESGEAEWSEPDVADSWFYYPDPNATEAIVYDKQNGKGLRLSLKRHPLLNGAYTFNRLPLEYAFTGEFGVTLPIVDPTAHETLPSQIFTSVVNNPFVFEASGDNTVGTGAILGIAANTEPISQGQFGQYPLIVFTTEGIYAMSVSSEGLYSASHPLSREVCNNAKSITPTGGIVFFTSERGLMAVSGGTVACVSDQLSGRSPVNFVSASESNFLDFLRGAVIAYDYRDSLLHIYNQAQAYKYVYSIKDHTFGKASVDKGIHSVANVYPDNLVQKKDGSVFSFARRPDVNSDVAKYSGTFTTRPLKLGSSIELKTITQICHLCDTVDGELKLRVYGSNDCRMWHELMSLRGKPWKYYTFQYSLSNFAAADTFAGTIVDYQSRFADKIR